jgi:hypothetical protein
MKLPYRIYLRSKFDPVTSIWEWEEVERHSRVEEMLERATCWRLKGYLVKCRVRHMANKCGYKFYLFAPLEKPKTFID